MTHTPGPWEWDEDGYLIGENGHYVLCVERGDDRGELDKVRCDNEADRLLIEAVPKLVRACRIGYELAVGDPMFRIEHPLEYTEMLKVLLSASTIGEPAKAVDDAKADGEVM